MWRVGIKKFGGTGTYPEAALVYIQKNEWTPQSLPVAKARKIAKALNEACDFLEGEPPIFPIVEIK